MTLSPGHILNSRYHIESLLGQGGFGAVYKARDANLDKLVAVKENLDTSQEAQRQFLREATVLANLSHPNLPRVTDHFIIPDQGQYLVMDFIEGDDLQRTVEKDGAIDPPRAAHYISQVMDALIYLHGRTPPVLHRDIKPANIKITPEGKAVLVDFGLVKLYDSHTKTTMGARAITPGYSPPEQYGQGSTDVRSDIYALGATFYMLVTGVNPPESVQRVAGDTLRPAHLVNPRVPPGMGMAISRAMDMVPTNRFPTMMDFRNAISSQRVSPAQTVNLQPGPVMQATIPVASSGTYISQEPLPPGAQYAVPVKKKPKTGLILGIAGGLVAIVAIICIALYSIGSAANKSATATSEALAVQRTRTERADQKLEEEKATEAAQVEMTQAAQVVMTEAAATVSAVQAITTTAESYGSPALVFGPSSGSLEHTTDGFIPGTSADVSLKNFLVEATFLNPYSTSAGSWDYGFLFRHEGANQQYRLIISSTGEWELYNNTGEPDGTLVDSGTIPNLDTSEFGSNTVQVVAYDNYGELMVNGEFISELDLSARATEGDIFVATGMYTGDLIAGKFTEYWDFFVYNIP